MIAHEAMVTGTRYGGEQALQRGIVNSVEAEQDVLPKAVALAKSLAGKHRPTLSAIKRAACAHIAALAQTARDARR
jgi:enoyl-CoA hydratase/carnithine racemase